MIHYKNPDELAVMAKGGKLLGEILHKLLAMSVPGVTLLEIERVAVDEIKKTGGTPSFQTVDGYKWATCLCVNEVVVHGIPTAYALVDGDILTIDVGLLLGGLHTDTAWTKIIGTSKDKKKEQLLAVGQKALWAAIEHAKAGNRIGLISQEIQRHIEGAGFSIVRSLVGHGVGKELHEEPQVPGVLRGSIEKTPLLRIGETIAVEVIYAEGKGEIVYDNEDGWTLATEDRSDTAVFEHTIAITHNGPQILTKWPE